MKPKQLSCLALSVSAMAFTAYADATGFERDHHREFKWGFFGGDYQAEVEVIPSRNGVKTKDYVTGYVFNDRDRDGRMDRRERGIANVMVSNGYDVVRTDHRGFYKLPAKARGLEDFTVFVTKPAGYQVPTDADNVPQFAYHHLPHGSPELRFGGLPATGPQPESINFPMVRSQYKKSFKIAVSGDPQPYSNNEVGYVRDALANELAARKDLEFVIIEGDVMGDDLGLYPRFKKIMSAADIPVYFVAGNHDLDFDAPSDKHSLDTFKREWGPAYYSFDMGDVHFVVLDNIRYPCTPEVDNVDGKHSFCDNPDTAPTYNGIIDQAQMEWLANDLAQVPDDKLLVFNMHIPLVSFVDMEATKHQTDNTQWLYDLVGNRPAVALSGHTHTLETFMPGEYYQGWEDALGLGSTPFPQIITGATSGSWWSGDIDEYNLPMSIQRLGAPRGYLIFEFHGNRFASQFKAANKSAEEQMSVDFLSPTFLGWYHEMKDWANMPASSRPETPPVNINDLPDTSILTADDLAGGTQVMVNVWNGSRDSKVWVQIDDQPPVLAQRTQAGMGEGKNVTLDPFALKKQMYVFRYAAKSRSGNERTQGFEMFRGSRFGTADPQPLEGWIWTEASNHIWAADVPADLEDGVHVMKIMTKDTYGKFYKTTKTFEVMDQRPAPYFRHEVFE
ncbi:MAG: calcineurin-like phosphoesterase family protein [Pseudomonadota bacterium]|nr:calcineurin-like phosphoesterase family protein [Pseudomonadota bacterium]